MPTKVLNLDRLRAKLRALAPATKAEIMPALIAGAADIVATQKSLAPVRTGTLRNSIHATPEVENLRVLIEAGGERTTKAVRNGVDASYDYALGVEFGTKDTKAEAFFYPGYRANKKKVKSRAVRAVNKAAKKVAAGASGGT